MRAKSKIIKCILLAVLLCLLFSSCAKKSSGVLTAIRETETENAGNDFHTFSGDVLNALKSEFIELEIDKKNFSVSVRDKSGDYLWNSLPKESNGEAYAFAVRLCTQNGIYNLNTQDNSVCFGAADYIIENNSLTVNYTLSDNRETALKNYDEITKDDVYVSFSAVYTISAQSVRLTIDLGNAECTPEAFIESIAVMPYFGSDSESGNGDYIFVPDGCGAVMYTDVNDAPTDNVKINVYGSDPYIPNETECASASVPVYGVKRSDCAFAAIITDADALAQISASRPYASSPATAGASFRITPTYKNDNDNSIYYGVSYKGKISVVYKFLSGSSASYTGMASAAREEFITDGIMSSSKQDNNGAFPFYLTIDGADENETPLTTTRQAEDILSALKGKGINGVTVKYKGLLNGGAAQRSLYKSGVNGKLGGSKGLESLYEYTQRQNYSLMLDIDIFSSGKNYSKGKSALSLSGAPGFFTMENSLGYKENVNNRLLARIGSAASAEGKNKSNAAIYGSSSPFEMKLIKLNSLPGLFSSFLEGEFTEYSDGYSVNDAGMTLYSDRSVTRQEAKEIVSKEIRAVLNYGSLSVKHGNMYAVYNAEFVTDMAFDTYYPESDMYEPVPFAQAVLHGYSSYSGEPIDAGDPLYKYDMLQYIEYGAVPMFEWVFNENSVFCYSGYITSDGFSDVINFYNEAAEILSELTDDTITAHSKITADADGKAVSGVYKTTYSDGSQIYVNYTGSVVKTPDNIVVGPYDFVKVKY